MRRILSASLGFCLVGAIIVAKASAEDAIAPVAAAPQALDDPLSRLKTAPAASAEARSAPLVGRAGDLKRLRAEGVRGFDAKEIEAALLRNFEFQRAARPSAELAALLDVTKKLVRTGYLRGGYLDANVTMEYSGEADGLVLKVDEGPQYRTGRVRVVGAKLLPEEQLAARLQVPAKAATWTYQRGGETRRAAPGEDSTSAFWRADQPAPADPLSLTRFHQGIDYALAELGFPFARFTVGFERVPGEQKADLVATISDEGPEAVVNSLTVEGLTRHSEQEICDFLKLRQGMRFNGATCDEAYNALRNSCRFWRYAVTVDCSAAPTNRYAVDPCTVDVRVNVLEYELAPRLSEPLTEADEILIKASKWLETSWRESPGIELVSRRVSDVSAKGADRFDYSIVINNKRGIAARVQGPYHPWNLNIGAIASKDQLAIFDWRSGARISHSGAIQPQCDLRVTGGDREEGDYKSSIFLNPAIKGWSNRTTSPAAFDRFTAVVEPVAMLDFGRGLGVRIAIEAGILTACDDRGELQVEASTGRILRYRTHAGTLTEFKSGNEEFERLRQEIEEQSSSLVDLTSTDWPLLSALQLVLGAASAQPRVQELPGGAMLCQHAQKLLDPYDGDPLAQSLELGLRNVLGGDANEDGRVVFEIPQNLRSLAALDRLTQFLVNNGPMFADELLPRESWAWTWAHEYCLFIVESCELAEKRTPLTEAQLSPFVREYRRQLAAKGTGPIGLWVLVAAPPRPLGEKGRRYFAELAYEQFDNAPLDEDLKLLVNGEGVLPRLTAAIVRACDSLDAAERKQLRNNLGAPLGDLARLLFQRRDAHPHESPAESVTAVVEAAWNAGLRARLKDHLRQLASIPEPDTTSSVGVNSDLLTGILGN
jgi:hypothetical protein